ncbi:MAG TPA: phospholipase D-like domain-containing protein [Kiritimatiellia bacterium]|nr:phospholipase D-like domain-containing protein [Kiritimatiellia bacterium]
MNKWPLGWMLMVLLLVRASVGAGEAVRPVVNREYLPAVLDLINGATNSIEFVQLEMHEDRAVQAIEAALAAAVKRGVRVRGLLDDGVDFNAAAVERLLALGAEAKLDTPAKMTHSKLVVVDGKVVLLGSTNWTGNSMGNNNEANVRLDDPVLADAFARYFAALWVDSAAEPDLPAVESGAVKTVVNRQYFPEVMGLFNAATQRIRVVMYGINYAPKYAGSKVNQLVEALAAARARGVDVAVAMDLSDYNRLLNKVNAPAKRFLAEAGVATFDDPLKTTTHAKVVVADGCAVIGSVNWGKDALENRNETCVAIRDPAVVEAFAAYFGRVAANPAP